MPGTSRTGSRSPEYALLGFLYKKASHGYSLHQQLVAELGNVWHVSQSQSYAILKRLVSQGYLSATLQDQERLPSRQLLRITKTGRQRFMEWLQSPTGSSVRAIRLEFITRLYFANKLFPEMLPRMLTAQKNEVEHAIARLDKIRSGIPAGQPFNRLGLDLRVRQLTSILAWLDECFSMFGINSAEGL